MGMPVDIPLLDFSDHHLHSSAAAREELCSKVREACERHGCFCLTSYGKISKKLREDMFLGMKELFDLPEETKNKYTSPKPYRSYVGKCPTVPFQESFGIDDATNLDMAQSFTNLMWPQGHPNFGESLHAMSSEMLELNILIMNMIYESFGVKKKYDESYTEDSTSVFRMMKYRVPPPQHHNSNNNNNVGLLPHTDKNALTILCQNDVQGLELQSKDGQWAQVMVPKDAFIVIVGDTLKAWSNGRLHAARHRVVIKGEKERYSCGLFLLPKEEAMIEVPKELVDKEHPLLYRPFNYADYISYFVSKLSDDALEIYAGICH